MTTSNQVVVLRADRVLTHLVGSFILYHTLSPRGRQLAAIGQARAPGGAKGERRERAVGHLVYPPVQPRVTQSGIFTNAPRVDWYRKDLDDASEYVTAETILRDYARPGTQPRVYRAYIPLWLLSSRLWEDVDGGAYDWSEYDPAGLFPPIKVELEAVVEDSMSYVVRLHIRDGNHRVRYWQDCGYEWAGAWVLDYRG